MRKVLTFLSASLLLMWVVGASAQQAPDQFNDVDRSHWAYEAVEALRAKGILIGYPDGYFRGKRTLTRYEFAVALDRALKQIETMRGEKGDKGDKGDRGDPGPPGPAGKDVDPETLNNLRRLVNEFRNELAALGNSIAAINRRLDQMAAQIGEIISRLDKMPKIGGDAFFGVRGFRLNGAALDRDGRPIGGPGGFLSPDAVHELRLTVDAKIGNPVTVRGALTTNNYKNYLGGSLATFNPLTTAQSAAGLSSDTYLDQLEVRAPIEAIGRNSELTLGRFKHKASRLTLWRPDVDSYFAVPWQDDGNYSLDGVRLTSNFGSVMFEAFGAQTMSVAGTSTPAAPFNSPLAGTGILAGPATFAGRFKATGQPAQGQMTVDQLLGFSAGVKFPWLSGGSIRLHAIDTSAERAGNTGAGFSNVWILGGDIDLKIQERITLNANWGKTITGTSAYHTVNAHQNNAFTATVGYQSGPLSVNAGYRYIDPLFYAPGYWGRIGNWINPTNIQGPTFRAAYDVSSSLGLRVGGDFYTAARNRGGTPATAGLSMDDEIQRILVGLNWKLSKTFYTTADWEGVYWNLGGTNSIFGGGKVHPTEHYITLGAGLNLNERTLLRVLYQIGDFNGRGALNAGTPFDRYNFNTITSQVAVSF
jgi:hypothetical protein